MWEVSSDRLTSCPVSQTSQKLEIGSDRMSYGSARQTFFFWHIYAYNMISWIDINLIYLSAIFYQVANVQYVIWIRTQCIRHIYGSFLECHFLTKRNTILYFDPVSLVFINFSSSFHCLIRNDSASLLVESNLV